MNKLKNISVVPEDEGFQVIGNYKVIGETRFDDKQYKTVILFESMSYERALNEATSLSRAANCGLFDIAALNASIPLKEALPEIEAKMRKA